MVNCKGCKWKRFNLMSWLIMRDDPRRLYDRCVQPKVLEQQGGKNGFCDIAWRWPCTDGKLREAK